MMNCKTLDSRFRGNDREDTTEITVSVKAGMTVGQGGNDKYLASHTDT